METPTQYTQSDKDTIRRIEAALASFATEDNISRSAGEVFRALGFDVVNDVSERAVSPESLYRRVQNREASKRFKGFLEQDVAGSYYAGSLTPRGDEEYLATQSETATQPSTQQAGGTGSGEDANADGTQGGSGTAAQQDTAGEDTNADGGAGTHEAASGAQDTPADGDDTHEDTGDVGAGSATDDTGTDEEEEEEERDVHFFAVRLKDGVHLSRGETADLVRGFNRLMGSCPVVVAIWARYAPDKPPSKVTSPNAVDESGGVGGCAPDPCWGKGGVWGGKTPVSEVERVASNTGSLPTLGHAGSPAKGYEGSSPQRTYMTLGVCERSSYKQSWRVGSRLGKVRLMADVRCDKVHRGHMDILLQVAHEVAPLHTAADVWQGLLRVFSVGLLTKRFYEELEGWYFWAVRQALFPNDMERQDDYQSENRTALIRLVTRFIFVWFIKQKGLVNSALFKEDELAHIIRDFDAHSGTSGSYYNAIVQNLFFATLNQSIDKRGWVKQNKKEASDEGKGYYFASPQHTIGSYYRGWDLFTPEYAGDGGKDSTAIRRLFSQTPYVNGSLFDRLDGIQKEGRTYNLDGFSSHKKAKNGVIKRAFLPNSLFFGEAGAGDEGVEVDLSAEYGIKHTARVRGLLEILTSYYFTAEENTPAEEAVALDPELLGRVFENLLGAYNPETAESARKDSGSFYTPRAIVEYMTAQSLLAYFSGACPDVPREALEVLLEAEDAGEEAQTATLSGTQCRQVIEAVYSCRVLDPACGSGAFPMGVLQRLVGVLRVVDKDNTHWREVLVQRAGEDTKDVLRDSGANDKQERIDEITATFERQSSHPDYTRKLYVIQRCIHGVDIQPIAIQIAKLRFFVSLLCEQETNSDSTDNYGVMPLPNLETNLVAANTLVAKQRQTQGELESNETEALRAQRDKVRAAHFSAHTKAKKDALEAKDKELSRQLADEMVKDGMYTKEEADEVVRWSPYAPDSSAAFFDGQWMFGVREFDVVLGNPPYISAPTQMKSKVLTEQRKAIAESRDYETLHQKWDLYIPFMEKGLKMLSAGGSFAMIVPFPLSNQLYALKFRRWVLSRYDVTEIADLNGTKVFENATVSNLILFATNRQGKGKTAISHIDGEGKIRRAFVQPHSRLVQDSKNSVWNFTQQERHTNRHEDMNTLGDFCYISKGMVLNADEKSAKGEFKKEDLISEVKDSLHPREYVEAKDIGRYSVRRVRYLEYGTPRCPDKLSRPTFKELYEHDKLIFNRLGQLQVMLDDKMHCLQSDSSFVAVLWHDLHGVENKSITSSIKKFSRLARQEMEELSRTVSLEYLLGVMNSRWASHLLSTLRGGDYHIYPEHIRNIPIPRATSDEQKPIVELVRQVLSLKAAGEDTTTLERAIDRLVCDLYGLTDQERATIGMVE